MIKRRKRRRSCHDGNEPAETAPFRSVQQPSSCLAAKSDYHPSVTETLSIKVPVQTKTRLRAAARSRHTSPSALLQVLEGRALAGSAREPGVALRTRARFV